MTAVGFLLFVVGVMGTNVFGAKYGLSLSDYFFCSLILVGIILLLAGVSVWLWQVMP